MFAQGKRDRMAETRVCISGTATSVVDMRVNTDYGVCVVLLRRRCCLMFANEPGVNSSAKCRELWYVSRGKNANSYNIKNTTLTSSEIKFLPCTILNSNVYIIMFSEHKFFYLFSKDSLKKTYLK